MNIQASFNSIKTIVCLSVDSLALLITTAVFIVLFKRKGMGSRDRPSFVFYQLLLIIITCFCFICLDLCDYYQNILTPQTEVNSVKYTLTYSSFTNITNALYIAFNWLFVSHYLKASLLLPITLGFEPKKTTWLCCLNTSKEQDETSSDGNRKSRHLSGVGSSLLMQSTNEVNS